VNSTLNDTLMVLRDAGGLSGLPLMLAGVGLMLFGWRLWKICVALSFAVIGVGIATQFSHADDPVVLYSGAAAVLLGGLSFWMASHALGALGGLIGFGIVLYFLNLVRLPAIVPWIGATVGFIAAASVAVLYRRHMIILVTAFLGGLMFTGGLLAVLMAFPALYGTFRSMSLTSAIVVPFLVLVPVVMSFFYQVSEINRLRADS